MSRAGSRLPTPSPPTPTVTTAEASFADAGFTTFALEDRDDDRHFKRSLWAAVVVHALILAIHFPAFSAPEPEPPPPQKAVFVLTPKRYQPPPVEPTPKPPPVKATKVPIPDPTPEDPEPIRLDQETEVVINLPPIDPVIEIPERPPEPESDEPIHIGQGVTKPVKTYEPPPRYPEIARKARIQGVVILQSIIDEQGLVRDVKVLRGLPMGLTEAAVEAVRQWRFEPATLRGRPVAVYYNLTVSFTLQ